MPSVILFSLHTKCTRKVIKHYVNVISHFMSDKSMHTVYLRTYNRRNDSRLNRVNLIFIYRRY